MDKFISTAQSTIKNLSSEFKDFWNDPTISSVQSENSSESENSEN